MMTATLPNYFVENSNAYKLIQDKNFMIIKSDIYKVGRPFLRNSLHVLLILLEGEKILHFNNEDIHVQETDLLYLVQGNYFISQMANRKKKFKSVMVFFNDDFVLNFIKKYNIQLGIENKQSIFKCKKDKFMQYAGLTLSEYFSQFDGNNILLYKLKIEEIFLYSYINNQVHFSALLNQIIHTRPSRIKYILESNLDIITSVSDMCKLTRLSSKVLRDEMFKLYMLKPKEWLDKQRLEKSLTLLSNTNLAISEISTECGYSSVSWFISQFKKYYKITPLSYRVKNL